MGTEDEKGYTLKTRHPKERKLPPDTEITIETEDMSCIVSGRVDRGGDLKLAFGGGVDEPDSQYANSRALRSLAAALNEIADALEA